MTFKVVEGEFTGTGQSGDINLFSDFNVSLSGFGTASINLERSFDSGDTWKLVKNYTADTEERGFESESGVLYRLNVSSYTSGTIAFRLSQ